MNRKQHKQTGGAIVMVALASQNIVKQSVKNLVAILACLVISVQAMALQNAAPYTSATRYNLMGQETGLISAANSNTGATNYPAVRNTYDSQTGQLTLVEKGVLTTWQTENVKPGDWTGFIVESKTVYSYNSQGFKESVKVLTSGNDVRKFTQYEHDAYGRVICRALRMEVSNAPSNACTLGTSSIYGADRITKLEYQSTLEYPQTETHFSQVTKEIRAYGTALQQEYAAYSYDSNGRRTDVTDANGNRAHMTYDALGQLEYWYFPSKTSAGSYSTSDYEKYSYDDYGNRIALRKRDSRVINYQYDNLNRVIKKDIPNTTSGDVYYEYDLRGLELHARFGSDTGVGVVRTYDGHGRQLTETNHLNGSNYTVSYQHDSNGNRTQVTHPDGQHVVYGYDGLNRITDILLPGSSGYTFVDYDGLGRLGALNRSNSAVTGLVYDDISRVASITEDMTGNSYDSAHNYGYNPAGQMVSLNIGNGRYHYTANAKGVTGNYTVNGLNQYESAGGKPFSHDDNGNLTSDGDTTYGYDVENRLTSVSGINNATLGYDPVGRLNRLTVNGNTTYFLYDGNALIAEYNGSMTMTDRYVHSVGMDKPIAVYSGNGVAASDVMFLHSNHQGSVIAASDDAGNNRYVNTYNAYGVPDATNQGRFGYTGQLYLPELGLYYYKARIYFPELGRFLQTDPIGYEDQMNLYAYVGNDPVNQTDPTGMCPMCISAAAGAIIGGVASIGIQAYQNSGNINWTVVGAATVSGALVGLTGGAAAGAAGAIGLTGAGAVATVAVPSAAVAYVGGAITQVISNVESGAEMKGVQTAGVASAIGTLGGAALGQLETAAIKASSGFGGQGALSQGGKVLGETATTLTQEGISQATSALTSERNCDNNCD